MLDPLHQGIEWLFDVALNATFALSCVYCVMTGLALALRRFCSPCETVPEPARYPRVTVQIPTYNERAALNCARCCLDFDYPEDKLQILIGDDSNRREISAEIDAFARQHPRIGVCRRGYNTGYKPGNLNHMLPESRGDYILILDSDFLPERDFLRRLAAPVARDPSLAGVQASWRVANARQNGSTLMGAGIINVIHVVILPLLRRLAGTGLFCGSAELVRKDLLVRHGGWTPGALTEDVDYSLRLLAGGERILFLEDLACSCEAPQTWKDLFRQQMRWAYGVMRAIMMHGGRLLLARSARRRTKVAVACFCGGYLMVALMLLTAILGGLHTATVRLGAGAVPALVAWRMPLDFLLTAGMLVASLCAGFVAKLGVRSLGKLAVVSCTIGIVLLFYVGRGLLKALLGRPMPWFMLKKNGNEAMPAPAHAGP